MKDNQGLATHAIAHLGKAYMYGYTGTVTEAIIQEKKKQYPSVYTDSYIARTRRNIGRWATDCSGLVDLYLGVDLSADGYYQQATKRGSISLIPANIVGLLVFKVNETSGVVSHVGVYMGDGTIVEAKGVDYGVVRTNLSDGGWKYYGYCHLLTYDPPAPQQKLDVGMTTGAKGEKVRTWQNGLLYLGYSLPKYGADSDFGSETLAATIEFQKRHGFELTGVVNDDCLRRLVADIQEEIVELLGEINEAFENETNLTRYL